MNKYAFWISLSTVMITACGSSSTSVGLELDASSHDTQSDVRDTSLEAWSEPDAKVERDTSSHDSWVPETLQEASSDTQGADASADTEKSCATGQKECRGYKLYQCVAHTWERQYARQDCCTTNGRFVRADSTMVVQDNQTSLTWGWPFSPPTPFLNACLGVGLPVLDSGTWRLPTLEEVQNILIGKADVIDGKYYTVCDPALDQKVFGTYDGILPTGSMADGGKYYGVLLATGKTVTIDPTWLGVTLCVH